MKNPYFKTWLTNLEEQEKSINDLMDKNGMILFFKNNDQLFGAPEESRLIFAKLKNDTKEDDDPMMPGFRDEAKFMGINLLKALFGSQDSVQHMFGNKDIPSINVCDREDVIKLIVKHKPKKDKKNGSTISKG